VQVIPVEENPDGPEPTPVGQNISVETSRAIDKKRHTTIAQEIFR